MRKLHGGTVQGAVLTNEGAAVDGNHLAAREGFANELAGRDIVLGLALDGYQHLVIHN